MIPEIQIALLIIFACSIVVSILFQRIRQPSIVGFLLTGILVGPHAFRLLNGQEEIEQLAEIGVVVLLFIIGMEFSFRDLVKSRYEILAGGASQVVLTIGLGAGLAILVAIEWHSAIFIGFLICLSSTAIGLSLLQKSGNMASPLGRTSLAILIFQDIAVVPLMLLIPVLGGTASQAGDPPLWLALGKGVAVVIVLLVLSRWVVPWAINRVAASRSQELFILALVALCIAISALTTWAGLSMALGAFIAGLMIANSPYSYQAMSYIIPLRDIFTSVFFVSIGMLLDISFVFDHPLLGSGPIKEI